MHHLATRLGRASVVLSLAIASLVVASPVAHADGFYYPSGIQTDVPLNTITDGGWTVCWSGNYSETISVSAMLADCNKKYILLAGGLSDSSQYMLAAAGERTSVLETTTQNATHFNNGTYFYFSGATGPDGSMGFAPVDNIHQNSADVQASGFFGGTAVDSTTAYRLSWHVGDWRSVGFASIQGGWRVGADVNLNADTTHVRAIYMSDGIPSAPELVVDAVNVSVSMGTPVPQDYRVLGLKGTDKVSNVVLEYEGTNIWGEHVGPTTTPPTMAGTYTVSVKSYVLTAADASIYWQTKHSATLTILWAPMPITDPALAGNANATNAAPPTYGKTGAAAAGDGWSVTVNGAPASAAGGKLLADPGSALLVKGKGFRPYSAVRIFFMSDPTELGSLWTDASGSFSTTVTVPLLASGAHKLQVNGYAPAGQVRSVTFGIAVGTTRLLARTLKFDQGSSTITPGIEADLAAMIAEVPTAPWTVYLSVATSAGSNRGAKAALAKARIAAVVERLRSQLEAAGVTVVVETTIWNQPGLRKSPLRYVYVDLNW